MRDSQRRKVYRAEREFQRASMWLSEEDIHACVREVFDDPRVRRACQWAYPLWAQQPIASRYLTVRRNGRYTRYAGKANANTRRITFAEGPVRRYIVLHEAAHLLRLKGLDHGAPHGREFAKTLIQLVAWFEGTLVADALRAAFVAEGVKHRLAPQYSAETLRELKRRGRALAAQQRR